MTSIEEDIDSLLDALNNSRNNSEAEAAIESLHALLKTGNGSESTRRTAAERLTESNIGVAAIVRSLESNWRKESCIFTKFAIMSLQQICMFVDSTKEVIVKIGGLETLIGAAIKYPDDYFVRSNTIGFLRILAWNESTKRHVATEECTNMVMDTMKHWPSKEYIQEIGCKYFIRILEMKDVRQKLQGKQLGSVLGTAMDILRLNEEVFVWANQAMDLYRSLN